MSDFQKKCGDVLTGGATGASVGGKYWSCNWGIRRSGHGRLGGDDWRSNWMYCRNICRLAGRNVTNK